MLQQDTIAALVTAVGESSVGIIRISGPEAVNIAGKLYKGKSNLHTAESHTIHYGYVYDEANDKKIDEALFLLMLGPRSFTGEDIVYVQKTTHLGKDEIGIFRKTTVSISKRLAMGN